METAQNLIIGNGTLVTRDIENPWMEHGALFVESGYIIEVGTTKELIQKYPNVEYIDAQGMLIMPGYINAHHHIYSAFARGMSIPGNHPKGFLDILEGTWWKLDRHLTLKATYDSGIATYLECIRNGVTTVVDHHASYKQIKGSLKELSKAADLLGIRTCLAYEISDRDGEAKMREAIQESFDFVQEIKNKKENMQKALIGMHASFTLSDATLELCKKENTNNVGYHIHVAEGLYDQEHCIEHYGCTVVERLCDQGILNSDSIAGHCIHVTENDRKLLKESGVTVVHNPESNMGNAVGCPDVLAMMDMGIPVCLGTDGYTSDMLESAKTAIVLQKHNSKNPDRGFGETAKMLFENNATLASKLFGETLGVLKKGAVADIIIVDYHNYTPLNKNNIDGHLFFGVNGSHTDTTIINGKVLMRHKQILKEDKDLYLSCKNTSAEIWRELYE